MRGIFEIIGDRCRPLTAFGSFSRKRRSVDGLNKMRLARELLNSRQVPRRRGADPARCLTAAGGRQGKLKIVHIIDSDAAVLSSLQALMWVEGFDARAYHSALDFIVSLTPEVSGCVVTYANMPKTTGVDLLTEMAERRLCLPIIVTSGVAAESLLERATKNGRGRRQTLRPRRPGRHCSESAM
jgi:PleD family two-component response regulator